MDDQAALSRLYPSPAFAASTVRIHGNVYFGGVTGQGMQGVNVVARWLDPNTNKPSRAYVATSVSGFLFSGNAGNIVTGYGDASGQPYTQYGSNDTTLEGFFDLAGLQIPNGGSAGQYQLTVEPIDTLWSETVGPYEPLQVNPSGSTQPVVVNVTLGGDFEQDIVMQSSALQKPDWFGTTSFDSPSALPVGGDWAASLSGYGNMDYFWFSGQANRTLSVIVTALDDLSAPSISKSQPVIGMWALSDPEISPAPANTPSAFNSSSFGVSILNAQLLQSTDFRIGISDFRGDGRPDYRYHSRVLYGDSITPTRASANGGTTLAMAGLGFQSNTRVSVGNVNSVPLAVSATQILVNAPAQPDGLQDITLTDPPTLSTSVLSSVLTYGAGPNDTLQLVSGSNPATPVGGQAPNPIRVQVLAPDGLTPVAGASVFFTATPAVSFSACGGGSSCTVLSDESGQASTAVTVLAAGTIIITAQLAPASYLSAKQVQATLLGTSSALDLSLAPAFAWIAQAATANVTLTARVLSNGVPISGRGVNYYLTKGSGTLNPPTTKTNANGYATSTLQLTALSGDVQVSACAEPGDVPCQSFYGTAVLGSSLRLQALAGNVQFVPVGQNFQPLTLQVTDSSVPPHPVLGVSVTSQSIVGRTQGDEPLLSAGDTIITNNSLPIILTSVTSALTSDVNGLVNFEPTTAGFQGALAILGTATTGSANVPFELQTLWPVN